MAAPTTFDEFLELVRKSGVVEEKRLNAYLQKMRTAGTAVPSEPGKLAGLLVRDGILTHFQAEQFLLGKWRRFTIGKYKVLERLGSGGMGSVYLCEHKFMRRRAAVKVLPQAKAEDPAALERFYREARAVAALDHPNIVRAYDIDQEEKLHFLVMEYVDGSSMQEIIKKFGPMDVTRAAHYIRQAAIGLQHAHQTAGLVHRDIKPGNLLVDRTGTVKILDMGLARFFHDTEDDLTKKFDENVLGTADYLAPEQALDSHSVDIRADIYSLGATFYFLLTGNTPFSEGTVAQKLIWHQTRQPKPVRTIRPDVPAELAAVLDKMMAKSPGQRYQTPSDVVEALAPWTQQTIAAPPTQEMPYLSPAAMGQSSSGDSSTVQAAAAATRSGAPTRTTPPPTSPIAKPQQRPAAAPRGTPPPTNAPSTSTKQPPAPPNRPGPEASGSNGPALLATLKPQADVAPAASPWEQLEPETEDPSARLDTAPVTTPSSQSLSGWMRRKKPDRRVLIIAALVLIAAVGSAIAWAVFGPQSKPEEKPPPPRAAATFNVTHLGLPDTFKTVREALGHTQPGDRIVVLDDKLEETLNLDDGKRGKGVTLEAGNPAGQVLWSCPKLAKEDKFVKIQNVSGLHVKGFVFDCQNQVSDAVTITQRCPGLILEDVIVQGFLRSGVVFWNCSGDVEANVVLRRVRMVAPAKDAEAAVVFNVNPRVTGLARNQFITVTDCRLEGPYKAAVEILGPMQDVRISRNRIFNADDGVFYPKVVPSYPINLVLENNTFCNIPKVGLHFQGTPDFNDGKNQVIVNNNLFLRVNALVGADEPLLDANKSKVMPNPQGNVRDKSTKEGNVVLPAKEMAFDLPSNPADANFLFYPASSPLNQGGVNNGPTGVPPQ